MVMDPLSIAAATAGLARFAYGLSGALLSGIQAARHVDATLQAFHGEVSALANVLNLVELAFKDSKLKHLDTRSREIDGYTSQVLDSLKKLLKDCDDTLSKLKEIIENASKDYKKSIFRRTVSALKLDFKSAEILHIRHQIQTYTSTMQMTLILSNISITLSQKQSSTTEQARLESDIKSLEELVDNIEKKLEDTRESPFGSALGTHNTKIDNLSQYLDVSKTLLSSATTYHGSMNGSVVGDPVDTGMVDGSVTGIDQQQCSRIESWRYNRLESEYFYL
jgi:chromosome segregation ATPase